MTFTAWQLADGRSADIEFEIEQHGSAGNGWDDAGEASIVCIIAIMDADGGDEIKLDDTAREDIEMAIAAKVDAGEFDGSDDYD